MWSDNETDSDLLGFQVHADLLRVLVTDQKMLPLTIGVFGDWGGGKTSLMKMLQRDLNPTNWKDGSHEKNSYASIAVVYVNTWQFEGYDDAKSALLSAVLVSLANHKTFGPRARDAVKLLIKSVNWMRVARNAFKYVALPAAAAFATGGTAAIPAAVAASTGIASLLDSKSAGKTASKDEKEEDSEDLVNFPKDEYATDLRTFRERFSNMLTDSGITSLIVLVDDLDRCTPDRIIENLEAIKLFLNVNQTAFIIGADRRIVEHAIRTKYALRASDDANGDESNRLVKDYLEKLVQIPYTLPRLSASEIQTYMVLLFCQYYLPEADSKRCIDLCNAYRAQNRYSAFDYTDVAKIISTLDQMKDLAIALAFSISSAPLIADGLKGNPRQLKRFLNALLLRKKLAKVAKLENIRDDILIKLMILEYTHSERFLDLFQLQSTEEGRPEFLQKLEECLIGKNGRIDDEAGAREINSKWATIDARRWIAMAPSLNGVDLRDYFWISRDKLQTSFTGMKLIPPAVRQVLEDLFSQARPKQQAAAKSATTLRAEEQELLLSALEQRLRSNVSKKDAYDAFRSIIEYNISRAAELLASILLEIVLDEVPAGVGMDLASLIKKKPELSGVFEPATARILASKTKVGAALVAGRK